MYVFDISIGALFIICLLFSVLFFSPLSNSFYYLNKISFFDNSNKSFFIFSITVKGNLVSCCHSNKITILEFFQKSLNVQNSMK